MMVRAAMNVLLPNRKFNPSGPTLKGRECCFAFEPNYFSMGMYHYTLTRDGASHISHEHGIILCGAY